VRVALYQRIVAERANLLAALQVSLDLGHAEAGLRLCCALRSPWITYGDVSEGAGWLDRFFALDAEVPDSLRARALVARAELAFEQQDYEKAASAAQAGRELARECGGPQAAAIRLLAVLALQQRRLGDAAAGARAALAAARAEDDPWEEGLAHIAVAAVLSREADLSGAQTAYEAALEVLRGNNGWGIALAHYGLGGLAMSRQDRTAALGSFRTALGLYREIDARPEMAKCLAGIGWAALATGELSLARESMTESAQLSLATGQRLPVARGLTALGVLALAEGDPERAIRLEGAAGALRAELGKGPGSQRLDVFFADARQRLGDQAAGRLLAEGRALGMTAAVGYGISEPGTDPPGTDTPGAATSGTAASGTGPHGSAADGETADRAQAGTEAVAEPSVLTPRELQIAMLVARGLSNKGIADELVISPATAARHVANIFTKLGFTSRAQLAAWVAGRAPSAS
jgi:ATP/maltotriose-dependent transcriptional regulator MalT